MRFPPRSAPALAGALLAFALGAAFAGCHHDSRGEGACGQACSRIAGADCDYSEEDCLAECEATRQVALQGAGECASAFDAYLACFGEAKVECLPGHGIDRSACRVQADRFRNACWYEIPAEAPCSELPDYYRAACGGAQPMMCLGSAPAGCLPGGGEYPDLYCCGAASGADGGIASGADAGTPIVPGTAEGVVRACALAMACNTFGAPSRARVEDCATELWDHQAADDREYQVPTSRFLQCASATDCASFNRCMSLGHDEAFCAPYSAPACDGSVRVLCPSNGGAPSGAVDCGAWGMTCQDGGSGAVCVSAQACTQGGYACSADGTAWTFCDSITFVGERHPCSPGESCVANARGDAASCLPTARCQTAGVRRCDGDVLRECASFESELNYEEATDCGARPNGTCSGGACASTASACTETRCDGAALKACVFGQVYAVDCASLGLATCSADVYGILACR